MNTASSSTVIFWGAGATAALGMRTTDSQGDFILKLTGADRRPQRTSLGERVGGALGADKASWSQAVNDLLVILGDEEESHLGIDVIENQHLEAMARNWRSGAAEGELRSRIIELRLIYDWPALKDIVRICPGVQSAGFQINDLFNIMDMHLPLGHGFRADEGRFLSVRRLIGAKAALRMLLHMMFYVDYQIGCEKNSLIYQQYYDFAVELGRRMQRTGGQFSSDFDSREFIRSDTTFVSLNYDPIGLWAQFVANRDLNNCPSAPHVGSPANVLQIFHDMGHFIPSRRVLPGPRPDLWYPMNEASAQRINEDALGANQRIRLSKFLFPHGCLCWRECPDCGKLSAFHGHEWNLRSKSLIPPPPLKSFDRNTAFPSLQPDDPAKASGHVAGRDREIAEQVKGRVDARACLHCGTLTSAEHTQTIMQSSFKKAPPSFIDEIQRDLRAVVMQAAHIIFMGYSLPPDDVSYRSFFAARCQRVLDSPDQSQVRCTIVNYDQDEPGWIGPEELDPEKFRVGSAARGVVNSAIEIFRKENVRFYGGGVPNVFLDPDGKVSEQCVNNLISWPEDEP